MLYIGTAGWSYPDWQGVFYPSKLARGSHHLQYYARFFNFVEVNTSYYHPQSAQASKAWVGHVAGRDDFQFSVKLWQKFVLERTTFGREEVQLVRAGLDILQDAGRLSALLVQFPQSFKLDLENRSWLYRILTAFKMYPLVVELRHKSWLQEESMRMLEDNKISLATIDQPVIGAGLPLTQVDLSKLSYFRFHGRNEKMWFNEDASRDERYDYDYAPDEIATFAEHARASIEGGKTVVAIFNNHFHGQAPKNAFEFSHTLTGEKPPVPDEMVLAYRTLAEIRKPDFPNQMELF